MADHPAIRIGTRVELLASGCDHPGMLDNRNGAHVIQAVGNLAVVHQPEVVAHTAGNQFRSAFLGAAQLFGSALKLANHLNAGGSQRQDQAEQQNIYQQPGSQWPYTYSSE